MAFIIAIYFDDTLIDICDLVDTPCIERKICP